MISRCRGVAEILAGCIAAGALLVGAGTASAVINDDCRAAVVIGALPFHDTRATAGATTAGDDPVQSCGMTSSNGPPSQNSSSVWYSFTAPIDETLVADTSQADYDTVLTAYTGACGALTEIGCAQSSHVAVALRAGQTVLLEVTSVGIGSTGGTFIFTASLAPPAPNDACETPAVIGAVPFQDVVDTTAATTAGTDPLQSCNIGVPAQNSNSVWYRYTVAVSGMVVANTLGSDYSTVLTAYAGTCTGRRELACDENEIAFPVTAGQTLLLEVTQLGPPAGGTLVFDVTGPVVNDHCNAAPPITTPFSVALNTIAAHTSSTDPVPSCVGPSANSNSVWYSYTAPAAGTLNVAIDDSDYAPALVAYTGSCGALTEVACDFSATSPSLSLDVGAGETVYIEMVGSPGGNVTLNVSGPAVPPSDDCTAAPAITTLPFSVQADTSGATSAAFDPVQSCSVGGPSQNANSVWYSYAAPTDVTLRADVSQSEYPAVVSAYMGQCAALTAVPCNPDQPQQLSLALSAGQRVLFEIAGSGQPGGGMLNFSLSSTGPQNDLCGNASVVAGAPLSDVVDTTTATTSPSDPIPSCTHAQNSNSVWYTFTAVREGILVADTMGSDYDTVLTAYTGTCAALTEVACNAAAGGTPQSQVSVPMTAGQTILLEVTQRAGPAGGTLMLHTELLPNPTATPTQTAPATPTATSAATATSSRTATPTSSPTNARSRGGNGCSIIRTDHPNKGCAVILLVPAVLLLRRRRARRRVSRGLCALLVVSAALYARPAAAATCAGDCDLNGVGTGQELEIVQAIMEGQLSIDMCPALDVDGDGTVSPEELAAATNAALTGCGGPAPVNLAAAPPSASTSLPPVADFNGDGVADLAVTNANGNTVSIFFGGSGGLSAEFSRTLIGADNPLSSPRGIALGDFNGDGVTDIAVTNFTGASVSIFLGQRNPATQKGNGLFDDPINVSVPAGPLALAAGRFHGPTQPLDLIVVIAQNGPRTRLGSVAILRGNGDGTFALSGTVVVGQKPRNLIVGDFGTGLKNSARDGKPDVAVTLNGEGGIAILYGDGNGALSAPDRYVAGQAPDGITLGDFNSDGCLDAATTLHGNPLTDGSVVNLVTVELGACGGAFGSFFNAESSANLTFGTSSRPAGISTVDLNGDSQGDLAVTDAVVNQLTLFSNHSTPHTGLLQFDAPLMCSTGESPQGVAVGDFNGDGVDDVAVANAASGDVSVFTGDGKGTACPPSGRIAIPTSP